MVNWYVLLVRLPLALFVKVAHVYYLFLGFAWLIVLALALGWALLQALAYALAAVRF